MEDVLSLAVSAIARIVSAAGPPSARSRLIALTRVAVRLGVSRSSGMQAAQHLGGCRRTVLHRHGGAATDQTPIALLLRASNEVFVGTYQQPGGGGRRHRAARPPLWHSWGTS